MSQTLDCVLNNGAGWVQAIGSLIGLGIAIWVPARQAKKAKLEKRLSMLAVAEAAHTHACNIRDAIDASDFERGDVSLKMWDVYDKSIIAGVVRVLQRVPFHELGSGEGVIAMLSLTDQMVLLGESIEIFIAGPYQHPELSKVLEDFPKKEEFEAHKELYLEHFSCLAKNARQRLNHIDKDYQTLLLILFPGRKKARIAGREKRVVT